MRWASIPDHFERVARGRRVRFVLVSANSALPANTPAPRAPTQAAIIDGEPPRNSAAPASRKVINCNVPSSMTGVTQRSPVATGSAPDVHDRLSSTHPARQGVCILVPRPPREVFAMTSIVSPAARDSKIPTSAAVARVPRRHCPPHRSIERDRIIFAVGTTPRNTT